MAKQKQDTLLFTVSILSIAVMQATAQAVGGILNTMAAAMPEVDATAINSLSTVPNLGFFFGLYTPLIVVLLSRFYKGDQLAKMVGYENAIGSVGSSFCSMVAGFLVVLGWRAGFAVYLLSAIPLVLFTLFVNLDDEPAQVQPQEAAPEQASAKSGAKASIPVTVYALAAFLFCFFIFQLPMAFNLGNRVFESGVAGTRQENASTIASTIYSFFTLIGIPVSIFFGNIRQKLGAWTIPFALLCNVAGFGLLAFGSSVPMLMAGGLMSGVAFATVVPYAYTRIAEVSPAEVVSASTTIAMILLNLGVFCSPIVLPIVASAIGDGSPHLIMMVSMCAFAVFAAVMAVVAIRSKKSESAVAQAA